MISGNNKKLQQIQEEKKRLRDRIQKLNNNPDDNDSNSITSSQHKNYEDHMTNLLQRKKKLEEERERQRLMKKMQDQYIERRNQAERERRMEQIRNQKRMIELEVGMKRMVFQGVKEKVKGVNSEQLMMRAMLRDQYDGAPKKPYTSKGNVRRDFQQFLQTKDRRQHKQKWDVYELNEKRFQIFEQKEEALMRQILLKELVSRQLDEDINVLKMNKEQLEDKLEQFGITIEDYIQPVPKETVISIMPEIQKMSKQRIQQFEERKKQEFKEIEKIHREKAKLKEQLLLMPTDTVKIAKSVVYDLINEVVFDYEKRLNRYQLNDLQQLKKDAENRYAQVLLQSEDYQYSKFITLKMLEKIHQQFILEAAQETAKLHDFAHMKTQQCFQWMFSKGTNIPKKLTDIQNIDFQLNFQEDSQNLNNQLPKQKPPPKNQLKKEQYLNNFQDYQSSVFDVDKLTTQLINQINLLEEETRYFSRISTKIHGEKDGPDSPFRITYERQLYVVTNSGVFNAKKLKDRLQKLGISDKLQLLHIKKFHNFWIIHDNEKVSFYSPWGLEVLPNQIGERISNPCGKIIYTQFFPIYTFTGFPASIMIGFEKGQILKYNLNLDRIQNQQTNHAIYFPVLPQIKNGQQPPFPLQKKGLIKVKNKKFTQNVEIHEFRQFFEHHTTAIIGIVFYRHNSFITVDKNMKCAIWYYEHKEGVKSYKPAYTFQFTCSNHIYKQSQNPRFKNIYPSGQITESAQNLYKKWLQTEGFLKKQIYNNPKKKTAMYRAQQDGDGMNQIPIWKVTYDDEERKVIKIYQSYYSSIVPRMEAKSARIWRQYLMILCERDHVIREDLKTLKVYGWDIENKKMRSIGVELDVFKNQVKAEFQILDNMLVGVQMHLMAVLSSGRILIFSLMSGQLLRNVADPQFLENPKYSSSFFTDMTARRSLFAAATKNSTLEISLNDHNKSQQQKTLNEMIKQAQRKYINLI